MFKFTPKTEQEALGLLEKGNYEFIVKECNEKISRAGNPQLEVILLIVHDKVEHLIYDYLSEEFMVFKLKHFIETLLGSNVYQEGSFNPKDSIGKKGMAKIMVREDKDGKFPTKNSIADYLPSIQMVNATHTFNDAIPFWGIYECMLLVAR